MLECSRNKSFEILACISEKPDTHKSFKKALKICSKWVTQWWSRDARQPSLLVRGVRWMSVPKVIGNWDPGDWGPNLRLAEQWWLYIPKQQLKIHKPSKHDETKNSCDQCDYKTKNRSSLNFLKQSKHEGINHLWLWSMWLRGSRDRDS